MSGTLSDHEIISNVNSGHIKIEPFNEEMVQPASYDLTLDSEILVPTPSSIPYRMDLRSTKPADLLVGCSIEDGFELTPGGCILASTKESIGVPSNVVSRIEGKSTLGRIFLSVHITAGFIDPGFEGKLTLEVVNHGPWRIVLWPGMKIAQVSFSWMSEESSKPYGSPELKSHYQGQGRVTAASSWGSGS